MTTTERTGAEVLAAFLDASGGRMTFHRPGAVRWPHVVITTAVHGDETGPLWACAELIAELEAGRRSCEVPLTIAVGNPSAVLRGRRFVDEDLNRAMRLEPARPTVEARRAEVLKALLREAALHVDLHQTRGPTDTSHGPFAIGTWGARKRELVQAMGITTWCVSAPGSLHAPEVGVALVDEYAEHHGAVTTTVEVFQRGVRDAPVQASRAVLDGLLEGAARLSRGEPLAPAVPRPIRHLELAHVEDYHGPGLVMRPLPNLAWVDEGEVVTEPGSDPELRAPASGFAMFAKFGIEGPPLPLHAYRLFRELDDPADRWASG